MKSATLCIALLLLIAGAATAQAGEPNRYMIAATSGVGNLLADNKPYFAFDCYWGGAIGVRGSHVSALAGVTYQKNYSDRDASDGFTFFADKGSADLAFQAIRAGLDLEYRFFPAYRLTPIAGAGVGYMIWKVVDPVGDSVIKVTGDRSGLADFKASEMYLSASAGMEFQPADRWVVSLKASVDYLTSIGTSFADSIESNRGRLAPRAGLTISYLFGGGGEERFVAEAPRLSEEKGKAEKNPGRSVAKPGDADGDGVPDKSDKCPSTADGVKVDADGCPYDSDGDGVPDNRDDCPKTPAEAAGMVDLFGCPVDSDFDGVPDYRDSCRFNAAGALVDPLGCPTDADSDGVADGLDDCPNTPAGIEVDPRGCMDVAFLRDTMRVNIDYDPGSFEVDVRTRQRLQPLVRKLKILADVKILIIGYTDNVGPSEANQSLSQKRANRMRDWLASEGIASERMTPVGQGETNFLASNETADGRIQNRRIELIFSR